MPNTTPPRRFVLDVSSVTPGDDHSDNPASAVIDIDLPLAHQLLGLAALAKSFGLFEVTRMGMPAPVFYEEVDEGGDLLGEEYDSTAEVTIATATYIKWRAGSRHGNAYFQTEHLPVDDLRKFVSEAGDEAPLDDLDAIEEEVNEHFLHRLNAEIAENGIEEVARLFGRYAVMTPQQALWAVRANECSGEGTE